MCTDNQRVGENNVSGRRPKRSATPGTQRVLLHGVFNAFYDITDTVRLSK